MAYFNVSPSQLQKFSRCPYAWKLSREIEPVQVSRSLNVGREGHKVLHLLNAFGPDAAAEYIDGISGGILDEPIRPFLARFFEEHLRSYQPPSDKARHEWELTLKFPLRRLKLVGIIDRFENGVITDYKFVRDVPVQPGPHMLGSLQLYWYAFLLQENGFAVKALRWEYHRNYYPKTDRATGLQHGAIEIPFDERACSAVMENAFGVISQMRKCKRPTQSFSQDCQYCEFKELCMTEINGGDSAWLKATYFKAREGRR